MKYFQHCYFPKMFQLCLLSSTWDGLLDLHNSKNTDMRRDTQNKIDRERRGTLTASTPGAYQSEATSELVR
jgi:hypothetical protein